MHQNLVSIAEAADLIGVKPWDVQRLIDEGLVRQVVLVDPTSLPIPQEQQ